MTEETIPSPTALALGAPVPIFIPRSSAPADTAPGRATALIVDRFGAYVGQYSERVRVSIKKEVVAEAPLLYTGTPYF